MTESGEDVGSQEQALGTASISFTTSTATTYCAKVTLQNALTAATPRWQAVIDLKGTSGLNTISGATFSAVASGRVTATPVDLNTSIAANKTTSFTFCGTSTSASQRPVIAAWNFESNAYATCGSNSGLQPTKAALAVAMAKELGRWDALTDLTTDSNGRVALSAAGLAACGNAGCPNTKALLNQQDPAVSAYVSSDIFNTYVYSSDLYAALDRQRSTIQNLQNNYPAGLPPAHKLTLVGGPTNLGIGACGPHYVFQADHLDGTALTSAEASNLSTSLCYFGYICGGNNYLSFTTTTTQCPTGRTCVAIDPTDGDVGSSSTTTAGSAPTYPLNRVLDPTNALLNTACILTNGKLGTLQSKCSTSPSTCGYLYCIAS
ncbi:MAG: hypothetical protein QM756_28230 [Polyangiaceae bacterium]